MIRTKKAEKDCLETFVVVVQKSLWAFQEEKARKNKNRKRREEKKMEQRQREANKERNKSYEG